MVALLGLALALAAVHQPPVLLVDNGSRRAASVLALRQTAAALELALGGREVLPVSLRFSDSIPAAKLGGVAARVLSDELRALEVRGEARAVVTPLFLGPSESFTKGVAECVAELDGAGARLDLQVGSCLVDEASPDDDRIARTLASLVSQVSEAHSLRDPLKVIVVDHGTPSPEVNAVRGRLVGEIADLLGERAAIVAGASMERREGAAYDFNEPLIEGLLGTVR